MTDRLGKDYCDVPLAPAQRVELGRRLGPYGIWLACAKIRDGVNNLDELSPILVSGSGLPELEKVITEHFGNRAYLIKLNTTLGEVGATCFAERQRLQGDARQTTIEIAGELERLAVQDHVFEELKLLGAYYSGNLTLRPEEAKELVQVTGECGTSIGARLGLDDGATVSQMEDIAKARLRYWRTRADEFGANRWATQAARVLEGSYEHLLFHLQEARKHLYLHE